MLDNSKAPQIYDLSYPQRALFPVVFNSPHSGRHYPETFVKAAKLDINTLRASEDFYVDEIFAAVTGFGCPLLSANYPRAFLDLNREPWELDPQMFKDQLPAYAKTSGLRIAAGLGTIAKRVSEKQEIYRAKLSFQEARQRIEEFYFPYHTMLEEMLQTTLNQFGEVLLIDCHSMPSSSTWSTRTKKASPDIILGDRFGSSCAAHYIDTLEKSLTNCGLKVSRNYPYAGGHITKNYAAPDHNKHVIQIEINRSLYMNEKTLKLRDDFEMFQKNLQTAVLNFLTAAFSDRHPQSVAAE